MSLSKDEIMKLSPAVLWGIFYDIAQIPRPSKKEEKIAAYVIDIAKEKGLEYKIDDFGNILIKLPATPGYENASSIVIQSHLDMVCEKNSDKDHDFQKDAIVLLEKDGWLTADGTTLGADNGIGAATSLATLFDESIEHGPLELLFTLDEETGLNGAANLKEGFVESKIMLNLDTEDEGMIFIGCAGGVDTIANTNCNVEQLNTPVTQYKIEVKGLTGGHSGAEIHIGRGNAIKILARALKSLSQSKNIRLTSIQGGNLRNAIPREASCEVIIDDYEETQSLLKQFEQDMKAEYAVSDPNLSISIQENGSASSHWTAEDSKRIINTLVAQMHGYLNYSQEIPDLIETSTNLASIKTEDNAVSIGTMQRSSTASAQKYIMQKVATIFELGGFDVQQSDPFPGWKPNPSSPTLQKAKATYEELYQKTPNVLAIHAGLECGIILHNLPGIDAISFGPTIKGAHSPDERVEIHSVEKFYNFYKALLRNLAK